MKSKPKGANCLKTFTWKAKHIKLKRSIIIIDEIENRREGRFRGGEGGEIRRNDFPFFYFSSPSLLATALWFVPMIPHSRFALVPSSSPC